MKNIIKDTDFTIKKLGKPKLKSNLNFSRKYGDNIINYVEDDSKILFYNNLNDVKKYKTITEIPSLELAGPRPFLYFNPENVKCAIVTCGGLAPGLNDVIRSLVMELFWFYGIKDILGIRYGYRGFIKKYNYEPMKLTPKSVSNIHNFGGTILGSSRGKQDVDDIVDFLVENDISVLFTIGGDGTLRGAHEIVKKIAERNKKISVIGIPKTIDNDINCMDKTFGFETAFSKAAESIKAAHSEAHSAFNGIGLVKLMGRHSGYVAANAALALKEVNFVLIPEIKFGLYGKQGFLEYLKDRLVKANHAVIVVAEGAGQNFIKNEKLEYDASGNIKLKDIGLYLSKAIKQYFDDINFEFTLKYIDPSYIIRSLPASPPDSVFCGSLAQNAVHAALSGRTDMTVGYFKNNFVHIPIKTAVSSRKQVDPEGELWRNVIEATGQPKLMGN